jgi:SAM-dependent methyltransferase
MHKEEVDFVESVKSLSPKNFVNVKVLEVGSLNINGSIKDLFKDCDYIGLDIGEGKGVDIVCEGQNYNAPDETYDTVISCECFEHNPYWLETFKNMTRMCKKNGGLVIFTCGTTGRQEHGTLRSQSEASPLTIQKGWNYYKNLAEEDFVSNNLLEAFKEYKFSVHEKNRDLYFYGYK